MEGNWILNAGNPDGQYMTWKRTRINTVRIWFAKKAFRFFAPKFDSPLTIETKTG